MTFIVVNHLLIDLCHFWLYLSLKRKNMDSGITGLCCVIMTHDHSTNKHQLDPNLKTHRSNLGDLEIIYIYIWKFNPRFDTSFVFSVYTFNMF